MNKVILGFDPLGAKGQTAPAQLVIDQHHVRRDILDDQYAQFFIQAIRGSEGSQCLISVG
jgi:hypothetical protein